MGIFLFFFCFWKCEQETNSPKNLSTQSSILFSYINEKIFVVCQFLGILFGKTVLHCAAKEPTAQKRYGAHTAMVWCGVVWYVCVYIFELSICAEEICVFALDECHYSKRWGTNRIASMLLATPLAHFRSLARSIYRFLCLIVAQIGWKSSCPVVMPPAITIYVYMYETGNLVGFFLSRLVFGSVYTPNAYTNTL